MTELKRILYVEDQKDIQLIAQVALEVICGYQLKICDSGVKALQCIAEFSPDLLLLDLVLPGMDGPTLLQRIRQQNRLPSPPVIFVTASILPEETDELMSMGALSVITKPFDPATLGRQLQRIWDRRLH